ncbi:hypothetical protein SAMN05443550_11077 [Pedobacter hartonius]|uniref:Nucleotide-diphospho-sugar transferase n=2 Tax=Pedobacter hartonius TaxID=425514 RepID=A0A1H4GHL2_9SPHI|nr:hypothetical protein SAMN05443550_11077 [Pedobacter hartonius]
MEDRIKTVRIIIYTDNPEFFETYLGDFDIEFFPLSPALLEDMLAGTNFIHRRKVAVIDMTFRNFPEEGLVFIDSDTFFMKDPKPILDGLDEGVSLLHKREYSLEEGIALFRLFGQDQYPADFIKYITDREFYIQDQPMVFSKHDYSWNSGVVGLNPQFADYMTDVFTLTDVFYANSEWFISEQMAFSLILQRTTHIRPAENFIFHYWGARQKILVDRIIQKIFSQDMPDKLRKAGYMRSVTRKLQSLIESDLIYEQLEIAVSQRNFNYSAKKVVQYFLLKFFNVKIRK